MLWDGSGRGVLLASPSIPNRGAPRPDRLSVCLGVRVSHSRRRARGWSRESPTVPV